VLWDRYKPPQGAQGVGTALLIWTEAFASCDWVSFVYPNPEHKESVKEKKKIHNFFGVPNASTVGQV
jgi:hypothetical protein